MKYLICAFCQNTGRGSKRTLTSRRSLTRDSLIHCIRGTQEIFNSKLANLLLAISSDLPSLNLCPAFLLFNIKKRR
jgi:hypothetical protein